MDYVVIGGDARFEVLARLLAERGEQVSVCGREASAWACAVSPEALNEAENIVVNCPPKVHGAGMSIGEVLSRAKKDARIFACGPGHPAPGDDRLIDLWADEALLRKNARLTAEGALVAAMRASPWALCDLRCMIIGWGRVGRALTELLVALDARVTVASRGCLSRHRAVERGAEAADTARIADALPGHRLIFNTAPAMVLDEPALGRVDGDAMLIDLASPPYGIDLRAAWSRGLRAWREPGLPGRWFPNSAARALLQAMDRMSL